MGHEYNRKGKSGIKVQHEAKGVNFPQLNAASYYIRINWHLIASGDFTSYYIHSFKLRLIARRKFMATIAATGTGSQSGREARRRRILERGSDRLALITGRIQSLSQDSEQSRNLASVPPQTLADTPQLENNVIPDSASMNHEPGKKPSQFETVDETENPLQPNLENCKNILSGEALLGVTKELSQISSQTHDGNRHRDITSRAVALLGIEKELSQIASSTKSLSQGHSSSQNTARRLQSAIAATENIRICSSAAAAILVLLSCAGFPIPGRSVVLFRPLYLLLATNVSIVYARYTTRGTDSIAQPMSRSQRWASAFGAGRAIGVGLLFQCILTALFMDFGIYAILLICGLSLVHRLG
ncbi:uncharacterized protein LOC127250427 [Andrographis paniculata]|uniref:uncharacterized protein LOC127250427 n=1 Tax=Andrographis paniculata TaxID=175694 RepID=UPI0021E7E505|nr:uncharacterized protein LOC127250427 [Andrographis paniculata]